MDLLKRLILGLTFVLQIRLSVLKEDIEYDTPEPATLVLGFKVLFDSALKIPNDPSNQQLIRATDELLGETEQFLKKPKLQLSVETYFQEVVYIDMNQTLIGDPKKFLTDFCKEQEKYKLKEYLMFTLLITKVPLGKEGINGISFEGDYCDLNKSCIMVRYDRDVTKLARIVAHEIAHSLGAGHDTTPDCQDKRNIMSMGMGEGSDRWSKCSRYDINDYLIMNKFSCLGTKAHREAIANYYVPDH